jgi:glycosyltransferase involved in cell wall biosynthesis
MYDRSFAMHIENMPEAVRASTPAGNASPRHRQGIARSGNIYFNYNLHSACNFHRIILPLSNMPPIGNTRTPILFVNRLGVDRQTIDRFRVNGFKVVIDLDDDIWLSPGHLLYDLHKTGGVSELLIQNVRRADVVMVTNPVLATKVAPYHRNIVVVPNALPFDTGQFSRSTFDNGREIVYVGGFGHENDLRIIRDAVPREQFVIAGDPGPPFDEVISPSWQRIREAFSFAEFRPALEISQYMQHYDGRCISVAPLVNTDFNRSKSNLKTLEAGAKGLALVASPIHPYYNDVDKGVVLYASNHDEWENILKKLLTDRQFLSERREALMEHVRKYYHIRSANEIRRQVFAMLSE